MSDKLYADEFWDTIYPRPGVYNGNIHCYFKWGQVGKSHKVPRPYSYTLYDGSVQGCQNIDDLEFCIKGARIDPGHARTICFPSNVQRTFDNRMIARLRGRLGPQAQLGTQIFAEGKEAVQMAVKNLKELAAVAKAIRRKDLSKLKKVWKKPRRAQRAFAEAGGRWLEFSWGWAPTVQTIADAMAMTGFEPPPKRITSTHRDTEYYYSYVKAGSRSSTWNVSCLQSVKVGYEVVVTNPNVWLLQSLDMLNPGVWIYEAIPFSWLADYFSNVGGMIENLSRFAGLDMRHRYTTTVLEFDSTEKGLGNGRTFIGQCSGKSIGRDTLNAPDLDMKLTYNIDNPLTSSWRRGLNASSFLATRLK